MKCLIRLPLVLSEGDQIAALQDSNQHLTVLHSTSIDMDAYSEVSPIALNENLSASLPHFQEKPGCDVEWL